eukprot:XP_001704845.1 Hypothetical protein GL50803_30852 [Giardia lamblia ATCC 50803]
MSQKHSVVPHAVTITVDLWPFLAEKLRSTAIAPRAKNIPVVTPSSVHCIFTLCGTRLSLAMQTCSFLIF